MTDRYAVIGNPVAHTKSPMLQMAFARQCGQDMEYGTVLGARDGFTDAVRQFQRSGGKGMNITVPFKLEAFALADECTPRAQAAGAANTFTFGNDGSILADNTDGIGIVRDIRDNLGCRLEGRRILLLGAGGAVRGALLPILEENPGEVFIANRTPEKAIALARQFSEKTVNTSLSGGSLNDIEGCFDLIINGTASSLAGEAPLLPQNTWNTDSLLAYDMFYAREATPFMRAAQSAGVARCCDGLGMVVEQGAESFFLWRGVRPDTAPVIAALRLL